MMNKQMTMMCAVLAGALVSANGGAKEDLDGAIETLEEAASYHWKTTSSFGGIGRTFSMEGKTNRDGLIVCTSRWGENAVEMVKKGDAGAIKGEGGWRSLAEIKAAREALSGDGQGGRQRGFSGGMLERLSTPVEDVKALVGKLASLEEKDGVLVGTMTAEAVQEMSTSRWRRGDREGPAVSDASGSVKFWLAEGVLVKYETTTKTTMTINGEARTFERSAATEIGGIGETAVELPEEAKAKLGS